MKKRHPLQIRTRAEEPDPRENTREVTGRIAAVRKEGAREGSPVADQYTFEISASSDVAVDRGWWLEILGHSHGEVRMDWISSGNAPMLDQHNQSKQIGVIDSARLENNRMILGIRFSAAQSAQEIMQDVIDGIRCNISIGYRVHKELHEEGPNGEDVYRATDWEPFEVSIVSVPADKTVGTNRSPGPAGHHPETRQKESLMKLTDEQKAQARALGLDPENCTVDQLQRAQADADAKKREQADAQTRSQADAATRAAETARISQIRSLAEENAEKLPKAREMALEAITDSKTVAEFSRELMGAYRAGNVSLSDHSTSTDDAELNTLARSFSISRFIAGAMGIRRMDGAELEVSQMGDGERAMVGGGMGYIPADVLNVVMRAQTAGTGTAGGNLIATQNVGLIDALSPRLWMSRMGVQVLSGLTGNVDLPSIETEPEGAEVAESAAVSQSSVVFGKRSLSPMRQAAQVKFTKQLLLQSNPQIDAKLNDIIRRAIAKRLNRKGIDFLLGLAGTTAITTSGTLDRAKLLSFKAALKADDADTDAEGWLMNAHVEELLSNLKVDAGSGKFLYEEKPDGSGMVLNRKSITTGFVPSNLGTETNESALIYGAFDKMWMGQWGGIDIISDNITQAAKGETILTVDAFVDFAAEHPEYFAIAKDIA